MQKLKAKLDYFLNENHYSILTITAFIVLSTLALLFETLIVDLELKSIQNIFPFFQGMQTAELRSVFLKIEIIFAAIFSIEYILRIYSAKNKAAYAFSFFGIIDILAILPTYMILLIPGLEMLSMGTMIMRMIKVLRALRFLRFLRLVKLTRFMDSSIKEQFIDWLDKTKDDLIDFFTMIRRERLIRLIFIVVIGVIAFSSVVWIIEKEYYKNRQNEYEIAVEEAKEKGEELPAEPSDEMTNFIDVLWWGFVTLTTVGYGDRTTISNEGRLVAIMLMFFGIIVVSVLTGTVASILVDLKIKEGQGLKELKLKRHIVILGWNDQAEKILANLPKAYSEDVSKIDVALLNNLDMEIIGNIRSRFETSNMDIYFVKGQPTNIEAIKRSSILEARSAIILSDTSTTGSLDNADERTIIVASSVKDLAPKVKVVAQLQKSENLTHLERSGVEDVVIDGDFGGYLLSHAPFSPGIPMLAREILTHYGNNLIKTEKIPGMYVGERFPLASEYFHNNNMIMLGVLKIVKEVSLQDIASGGMGLDAFIREKFGGMENDYFGDGESIEVIVNPGYDYVIEEEDMAFVIRRTAEEV